MYGSEEERNKELDNRINGYKNVAALVPKVIEIIKEFDGKVYNCRLDEALRKATNNDISISKNHYSETLYISGHYPNNYHSITLASFEKDNFENKRINAQLLIDKIEKSRDILIAKAEELEECRDKIQEYKSHVEEAIESINAYVDAVPADIQDIFEIRNVRKY